MSARNIGLGASDAAAAVGLNPYKSPYQLWQEKTGLAPPEAANDDATLARDMGHLIEPFAIARFERKMKMRVIDRQTQVADPLWPVRWVTLDGRAEDGGNVEAKSVGFADPRQWGDEFEDGAIPMTYLIQVQHGLACTGAHHAWVPVVVLNRQFRIYRVRRDDELIAMLTEKEREFWRMVEAREPPPPIDYEDAALQWPQDAGGIVVADDATLQAVAALKVAKAKAKAAEMDADEAKAKIGAFMGTNATLVGTDGKPVTTWKTAKSSTKVDLDKLRAENPQLVAKYEYEQPGSRRMLTK